MLIKNLTIIIVNDRQDQLFAKSLFSATIAQKIIVLIKKALMIGKH
jgi:hypothetical protein